MDRKRIEQTLNYDVSNDTAFDLEDLLHPAQAFEHPSDVVRDPDLTLNEKRAILASWASDACAVEASPELRKVSDRACVAFDEIMDALRVLDKEPGEAVPHYRRILTKERFRRPSRGSKNNQGQPLQ